MTTPTPPLIHYGLIAISIVFIETFLHVPNNIYLQKTMCHRRDTHIHSLDSSLCRRHAPEDVPASDGV